MKNKKFYLIFTVIAIIQLFIFTHLFPALSLQWKYPILIAIFIVIFVWIAQFIFFAIGKALVEKKVKTLLSVQMEILVILLAFTFVGFGVLPNADGPWHYANAEDGELAKKSHAEIVADLNKKVAEGMFNISIASVVEVAGDEATVNIENIKENRYDMRVVIVRDDNGEELLNTDALKPNTHLTKTKFKTALASGTYPATATFYAYDKNHKEQGKVNAKIQVMAE
jgi:hypothetical protein